MKALLRIMSVVMVVAGLALASTPALQAAGCCSSNGACCVTSPGSCCSADSSGCSTFKCAI